MSVVKIAIRIFFFFSCSYQNISCYQHFFSNRITLNHPNHAIITDLCAAFHLTSFFLETEKVGTVLEQIPTNKPE